MPTYIFKCPACEKQVERVFKISEDHTVHCECEKKKKVKMEKVITNGNFMLFGRGWDKPGHGL